MHQPEVPGLSPHNYTELHLSCLRAMDWELERNMCELPDGVANSEVADLK